MKPIHVIGIVLATSFGIIWCVQIWSAGRWNTELQYEEKSGNFGSYYEQKRNRADALAFVHEAFKDDSPTPVVQTPVVSGSSWEDRLGKRIDHWMRAIKSIGHRSRLAPPGVYFTLTYISVRNPSGITGVSPGTQVVCVKGEGPMPIVKAGNLEFEAQRQYLTNDVDIAELAVRGDTEAQQAVASYIAKQQQAIDQRNDKRNMQPSGQP